MQKFMIYHQEKVVALIYDPITKTIRIGGNKRFQGFINTIIIDYFGLLLPKCVYDRNKVRFRLYNVSIKLFEVVKLKLNKDGVILLEKTNLERIMR